MAKKTFKDQVLESIDAKIADMQRIVTQTIADRDALMQQATVLGDKVYAMEVAVEALHEHRDTVEAMQMRQVGDNGEAE